MYCWKPKIPHPAHMYSPEWRKMFYFEVSLVIFIEYFFKLPVESVKSTTWFVTGCARSGSSQEKNEGRKEQINMFQVLQCYSYLGQDNQVQITVRKQRQWILKEI